MKFERFARTFCRNIGTFGANVCKPVSKPPHSALEGWTRNFEVKGARMNRFDCKSMLLCNFTVKADTLGISYKEL